MGIVAPSGEGIYRVSRSKVGRFVFVAKSMNGN